MSQAEQSDPPERWWLGALGAVALLIAVDVVVDYSEGHSIHIVLELVAMSVVLSVVGAMMHRRELRIGTLASHLTRSRREAERWRAEAEHALEGLAVAIDAQFERWALTPAEREVGLLLLKGLSLKEVAGARGTSERTARDQARAIYRKAGLSGRTELAAFFLEDLLLPSNTAAHDHPV
ncbi:MAG: LuxR C-terminal-related transcriptional regulator [Sandaracinaceae bacterium]